MSSTLQSSGATSSAQAHAYASTMLGLMGLAPKRRKRAA
jgi:hypothetical protein